MNIPFSFALTNTNQYGVIYNPWGVTIANSVNNAILSALTAAQQEAFGLLSPLGPVWLTSFGLLGDTASCKGSLGVWDSANSAFIDLYDLPVLEIAGGSFSRTCPREEGLYLPLGPNTALATTFVPVFKLTTGAACTVSGDLGLYVSTDRGGPPQPSFPTGVALIQAEDGTAMTDATGQPLLTES